ncbi:MAG: leucine-rich repeat domain-containing protein [Eubacteriaceae bacterium]|nr:leucine-rich repeat domain-containing protein [Eubacteriaceae bacterium]
MKKVTSILLIVIMIVAYMPVMAFAETETQSSGTCGENATWELDSEGVLTISGTGEMYDYLFYDEVPWYSIRTAIKEVVIEKGITTIGENVFTHCESLKSITIPDSVTTIGECAFSGCIRLTSITIPYNVTSIGKLAFSDCSRLKSITIPESIISIGYAAFSGCRNLTSITIPESITSIEDSVFSGCESLTNIIIPDNVTTIGQLAFSGCSSLQSITIPEGVISIGGYAFNGCSSLTNITIPESVTSMGYGTFEQCSSLQSITIPKGVTTINNNTFNNCHSLISITIPDSVTTIGECAFSVCSSLTSITIPDSVTLIDYSAFEYCENLKYVFYAGSAYDWGLVEIDNDNSYLEQAYIHYNATDHVWADEWVVDVEASCAEQGSKSHHCKLCDAKTNETAIAATGHTYKDVVTRSTLSSNGKIEKKCSECGEVKSTTTIYRPTKFTLSTTAYTYDGKIKKPTVTVKNSAGKTLVKDTDYTLTYASGRKYVGKYSVKITFKGKYSGSKTLYFNINPPKTSLTSLTASSKGFTVKWSKKTTQVTGYQIQYSTSSTFASGNKTVTVTSNKTTSKKIKSLKAKKKYYVRVRTYKTVNGTKYYSGWSAKKYVTTKA